MKTIGRPVHLAKMSLQQLKMLLVSIALMWLYACLTMLVHTPNETTDGVLHGLDQGITELLENLRYNLTGSMHSQPPGAAYSRHMMPGNVVHQEEARTHCTSVVSNSGSKNLILITNGNQGAFV